jgi:hypothetical protein
MSRPKLYPEAALTVSYSLSGRSIDIVIEHARRYRISKSRALSQIIESWHDEKRIDYVAQRETQ